MKSCVLDIGSNTIRAVVFEIIGGNFDKVYNKGIKSMLFDYTADGKLTQPGMDGLSAVISELCSLTADYGCSYHAFATSAFRDLINQQEVIDYISDKNGIKIHVFSGDEEAECDYLGICGEIGAVNGIGIDLGGGSCQLLSFSEKGLTKALSLPLGTSRLKRRFVSGSLPTGEEGQRIYDYVLKEIASFAKADNSSMFAMGGSARAALAVKRTLCADMHADCISSEELGEFVEFSKTAGGEAFLKSVVKNRYDTVVVGMIIMSAIADYAGADYIKILDCGVRDGYVRKYLI